LSRHDEGGLLSFELVGIFLQPLSTTSEEDKMTARRQLLAVSCLLMVAFIYTSVASGVDKGNAKYMGGTIASIPDQTEGPISLKDSEKLIFTPKKATPLEISWASIENIEYGQKAGRRIKSAIFLSPIAIFAKARKHFVTISYKDAGVKDQAVVFEFDKNDIRQNLTILKVRTGKDITYQDDEAKKQMGGGSEGKK
jgi:hypothetical protein